MGDGGGAFDGRCPCYGLLIAAESSVALLSEERGAEGEFLGAGEEAEAGAGGHDERVGLDLGESEEKSCGREWKRNQEEEWRGEERSRRLM